MMSPIINLQRRLAETGRIRIGEVAKGEREDGSKYTRPKKRETFRLTSANHDAIVWVAKKYGGEPHVWEDAPAGTQWELFTESTSLNVLIPPEQMSFSQYYELWSGGGCQRRCNGIFQVPSDDACVCDPNNRDCKPHTRLSIMLADTPGAGLWRLDTQGWNAANEIGGAFELAGLISQATGKALLPGTLRLDQRVVKRPNPKDPDKVITRNFAVPVLDFAMDLSAIARAEQPAIGPGLTPIPDDDRPMSLADELVQIDNPVARPPRSNGAEPVKSTGISPRPRGPVHEDDEGESVIMATTVQLEGIKAGIAMMNPDEAVRAQSWWNASGLPRKLNELTYDQAEAFSARLREFLDEGDADAQGGGEPPQDGPRAPDAGNLAASTDDPAKGLADPIPVPKPTPAKMRKMFALLGDLGVEGDDDQHDRVWAIVGHDGSFTDLTRAEVNRVIDQLEADIKAAKQADVDATSGRTPRGDQYDAEPFT